MRLKINEALNSIANANSVNHLLKGDKTRSQFLIEQLNLPKAKFMSLIKKKRLNIKNYLIGNI